MKSTKTIAFVLSALFLGFLSACNSDDVENPTPPNEEEVITTLLLNFTNAGQTTTFAYRDPDGDGGNPATQQDDVVLSANTTYTLTIEFLNEAETPAEDITAEVEEEGDEHQVFISNATGALPFTYTYGDQDVNGNPIGLTGTVTTGDATTGSMTVTLKHQPEVKSATSTIADGETDIEVSFAVSINQ